MKKFVIAMVVIIIVGAVLSGVGCAVFFSSDKATQNIEYTEKLFETDEEFTVVDLCISNVHKVTFERGEKCTVKYFDTNVTSFSVSAENGKLTVSESRWSWENWIRRLFCRFKQTDVVITVPEGVVLDINGEFNGATEVILPSWEFGRINFEVNGASNVTAYGISVRSVELDISGATNLVLSGKADSIKAQASGAVNMRCDGLECPQIDLHSSGSSDISLSGKGSSLVVDASGSGKIRAKDFTLERARIEASGSVDAQLTVSEFLKVDASGSADIEYWGDPQVEKSVSGSANIVKRG